MTNIGSEQSICISCGFCCDGTLFEFAYLETGEREDLPEKIRETTFTNRQRECFELPCHYFEGKCSIYSRKKAIVCSSYRCQLLKDFSDHKISRADALKIIRNAAAYRAEIFVLSEKYHVYSGKPVFKKLLKELRKINALEKIKEHNDRQFTMLLGKCNILEALLIRHFCSQGDFNSMKQSTFSHHVHTP